MNKKLTAILTSLSISPVILPALLFCDAGNPMLAYGNPNRSSQTEEQSCGLSQPTQRVEVKHIEGKGVGYRKGYSSLEGFFTIPSALDGSWFPFLDLRGHIFNDGKPAATGGLGLRYLGDSRVYGANVYYDYRETHHRHYNQVGAGLETLGEVWDFRLNAYIPVGTKHSHLFHTHFHEFKGNSMILKSRKEIAMIGANAEVGAHALREENYQLYAAAGPYYFERAAKVAWGGEGRLVFTAFDYLRLQLSGSYDRVFKGIVQGEVALTYSFGGKRTIKACNDCDDRRMVDRRALQRVDRNEIIVVDRKHQKTTAKNPETGDPYVVWFVNNTSHSLGTYESPFNTLANAQAASGPNDIIYVYVGDKTSNGMNAGITLQQGQQLLGAGVGQQVLTTRGLINVPAHDVGLPLISNANALATFGTYSAVTMNAGNNVVSGFNLLDTIGGGLLANHSDTSGGIRISGGMNYLIKNNIASTFNGFNNGGNCLNILGGGNVTVLNNTFMARDGSGGTFGVLLHPYLATIQGFFVVENNLFTGISNNAGLNIDILFQPTTAATISGSPGIFGDLFLSAVGNTCNSQANTFGSGIGIDFDLTGSPASTITVNCIGNHVTIPAGVLNPTAGVNLVEHTGAGPVRASFHDNVMLTNVAVSPPIPGYRFRILGGSPQRLTLDFGFDNFGTVSTP